MIELHAEAPKIIVPLFARTLPELTALAAAAQRADAADLVELRLDPLPRQDWPTALAQVRAAITKPHIVTIRTAREGGEVDMTPTEYGEACQRSCGTPPTGRVLRRCSASTTLVPRPTQAS